MTNGFGLHVANTYTMNNHKSVARLSSLKFSHARFNKATNCLFPKITHMLGLSQMTRLNARCLTITYITCRILYTNIDLKLRNKSHGPMHYKIGVTCVYNGHLFYTLL